MELELLGAAEAAQKIRDGVISSEELLTACLAQVDRLDDRVEAWAFLDAHLALKQAKAADSALKAGVALGPLYGVPVGIKDIIDTKDMPTEDGTILHQGRKPQFDGWGHGT